MRVTHIFFILTLISPFVSIGKNDNRIIDSLNQIITSSNDPKKIIDAKSELVIKYFLSGDSKKAVKIYEEAILAAQKINYLNGIASLYNNRGNCFYNSNDIDSAKHYFLKAYGFAEKAGDNNLKLRLLNNIGSISYMYGDLKEAMEYYEKGLKMESSLHLEEGNVISLNNIGFIYCTMALPKMGYKYFLKAEKIYSKRNSKSSLVYTYDGLSLAYKAMKKSDSAIYFGLKALEMARDINDLYSVGYELETLGTLYKSALNKEKALEYYNQALEINKSLQDVRLELSIYANLTDLYNMLNMTKEATTYAEKVMALEGKLNIKSDRKNLSKVFAFLHENKGEYKKAYNYLLEFLNYQDSLYNMEMSTQISELQTKYESDKKEKENIQLQLENEKKNSEINNQKTVRNYLILIILLFVLVFFGVIFTYRKIKFINSELNEKNKSIEQKNITLEYQKKEILDSIHYAKRIQSTLLANTEFLNEHIPNNFILFKPKDIVSGDFYWATKKNDLFYLAVCDSTGHGVPGAFMSLLSINFLNEAITEKQIVEPHMILNFVRQRLIENISKDGQKDGFDGILLCLNTKTKQVTYSAANNSPIIIRKNEIIELSKDRMPVGKGEKLESFTLHQIDLQKDDTLYLYTDGYADQFGGPKGKKFLYKKLNEFILNINCETFVHKGEKLNQAFEDWRGKLEQVDDVLILGLKI